MTKDTFPKLSRQDLIASIERAQADFLSLVSCLTPKEASRKGITAQWSLKDLLAHLVGWHHEAMKRIPELAREEKVKPYDVQEMNRKFVENLKELPWGMLLRDLRNLHSGLVEIAREVPERFLETKSGIYEWIYSVGCEHYKAHQEPVKRWVMQLKSQRQAKEERL